LPDIILWSVPTDATNADMRLRDPTVSGAPVYSVGAAAGSSSAFAISAATGGTAPVVRRKREDDLLNPRTPYNQRENVRTRSAPFDRLRWLKKSRRG
jgi:hypothetical protein